MVAKSLKYNEGMLSKTPVAYLLSQPKDGSSGYKMDDVAKGWKVDNSKGFEVNSSAVGLDDWLLAKGVQKDNGQWKFV